jgi:diketogulonate reductase-like aldo/keto reductase
MKTITFPDGAQVPAVGQGTWMMAERADRRADEIAALRTGIDLGHDAGRHRRDVR